MDVREIILINNMEVFLKTLAVVGAIETLVLIAAIIWGAVLWAKGIWPALWRLGNGLAKRKVAVFASSGNAMSIKSLLLDSKLFSEKNITIISEAKDVGISEHSTLYLVFWHDWKDSVDEILRRKSDTYPLIVYAPRDMGFIPEDEMKKLDQHRNTTVTNFRGRLLNDLVTAMITTSNK